MNTTPARIAPYMILGHGARGPNPGDKSVRTFGAQCVEVEVDVDTGEVRVLRVVASHDCGRVINPTMVESQVIGAVTQGIAHNLNNLLGVVIGYLDLVKAYYDKPDQVRKNVQHVEDAVARIVTIINSGM